MFAEDFGALAVEWLLHARFLPAKALASKMRAVILGHETPPKYYDLPPSHRS